MENEQNQEQELGFTLNGKDYNFDDLKDEDKDLVQQLKDLQMQLDQIEFKHKQVAGAKAHFTELLVDSVEGKSEKK